MLIREHDRAVVKWAVENGFPYHYIREYGLPDPALCVRLGLSSAYFADGRLVHWRADADGRHMDQLMFELTHLFGCCAHTRAYPDQAAFVTGFEQAELNRRN